MYVSDVVFSTATRVSRRSSGAPSSDPGNRQIIMEQLHDWMEISGVSVSHALQLALFPSPTAISFAEFQLPVKFWGVVYAGI